VVALDRRDRLAAAGCATRSSRKAQEDMVEALFAKWQVEQVRCLELDIPVAGRRGPLRGRSSRERLELRSLDYRQAPRRLRI
jgi:hypothetical protein